MKQLIYSITITQPKNLVFGKMTDQSIYPEWAKAWGEGMTYEGEWKKGAHISFMDNAQGGTKVILEELEPNEYIKARHIAMVNPENVEVELTDDMMKKWIGSLEEYRFEEKDDKTELRVTLTVDEAFQSMFDSTWPNALAYLKAVCEKPTR